MVNSHVFCFLCEGFVGRKEGGMQMYKSGYKSVQDLV